MTQNREPNRDEQKTNPRSPCTLRTNSMNKYLSALPAGLISLISSRATPSFLGFFRTLEARSHWKTFLIPTEICCARDFVTLLIIHSRKLPFELLSALCFFLLGFCGVTWEWGNNILLSIRISFIQSIPSTKRDELERPWTDVPNRITSWWNEKHLRAHLKAHDLFTEWKPQQPSSVSRESSQLKTEAWAVSTSGLSYEAWYVALPSGFFPCSFNGAAWCWRQNFFFFNWNSLSCSPPPVMRFWFFSDSCFVWGL
jgi:hypothetical protein